MAVSVRCPQLWTPVSRVHGGSYEQDPAVEARLEKARVRIAAAVRRRRAALDLTQEEVAELVGCTVTYYQKLEGAKCTPSLRFLNHLTLVLGCDLEEVFVSRPRLIARRSSRKKAAN